MLALTSTCEESVMVGLLSGILRKESVRTRVTEWLGQPMGCTGLLMDTVLYNSRQSFELGSFEAIQQHLTLRTLSLVDTGLGR
eukprot:14923-Amphidinium_carterae.1